MRLLCIAEQIRAGDVVMVPDFGAAHPAEDRLCPIGAGAVQAVRLLMIDPLHFVTGVQIVPSPAFVRIDDRALCDARLDE